MRAPLSCLAFVLSAAPLLSAAPPAKPAATRPVAPVFEGVVIGPDRQPVDAAFVTLYRMGSSDAPLSARTDAAGAFRIASKTSGLHELRVEKTGLAAATLTRVRPGRPLTIRLDKGGVIAGLVRDGLTRQPLAGARVEALEEGAWDPQRTGIWEPDAGAVGALTDAKGRFALSGVGLKLMNVSAVAPGYARNTQAGVRVGSQVSLTLFPGASISGTTLGADGRPLAGALVKAEPEAGFMREVWPKIETTDAQGRFEIAGVTPGRWAVIARAPNLAPAVVWVSADAVGDATVELRLGPGVSIVGRLVNAIGEPVIGRATVQELFDNPTPPGLTAMLRADAGKDGRFRITGVPPGSHALALTASGFAPRRIDLSVEGDVDLGDVALESGLAIRGRVRDRAGLGVADARLFGFQATPGASRGAEATAGQDGSFALGGLDPGTYRIAVRAIGYAPAERSVDAGAEAANFVLDAAGAITGCVVDAAGRAVTSYRASTRTAQQTRSYSASVGPDQSIAATDGCFRLDDVGEGAWLLSVSAPGYAPAMISNVKVVAGAATDVGAIRLASGGTVRGFVVDAAGAPVLGATVSVVGQVWRASGPTTSTGLDGAFELSGLAAGAVDLAARHPDYAEGRATGVEIDPAQGPAEARITLSAGGRIAGSLRKRDGQPVMGAMVAVRPLTPGASFGIGTNDLRPLREDGTFSSEHVAPGRYKVVIMAGARGVFSNSQERDVEVREGETTAADFVTHDILVTGRVTRAGQPAPGVRVALRAQRGMAVMMSFGGSRMASTEPAGPQRLVGTTRDDGVYELLADEPGEHIVSVSTLDGKVSLPSRTIELPDTDAFVLNLDFAGASLAGVVIDQASAKPLDDARVWARRKEGGTQVGSFTTTGADGRFTFELEPGTYMLQASATGYGGTVQEVALTEGGMDGLRLALSAGRAVAGRVVDTAGRGVGDAGVTAFVADGTGRISTIGGQSRDDGSFTIEGLPEGTCGVSAGRDGRFAVLSNVTPGEDALTLVLRPGALAHVAIRDANGVPVEGAMVFARADNVPLPIGLPPRSDAGGRTDLAVPAGSVTVMAMKGKQHGSSTVETIENGAVDVEIVLSSRQ